MTTHPAFKYIITLIITIGLFGTAFFISNYLNNKKTEELKAAGDRIAIELLSSETQFDILKESSCDVLDNSLLAQELDSLGNRLNHMESQLGSNNADVIQIKKYYSILQIKDYLLMKKFSQDCKTKPLSILYFYTKECTDCTRQGYVLTYLRDTYPGLRIYSFDYDLDLSAIKTLSATNKIPATFPALLIDKKVYTGLQSTEILEPIIAPYWSTTTATTTKKTP